MVAVSATALLAPAALASPKAYVDDPESGTVAVIDTGTNKTVGTPIPVGPGPQGLAISPNGAQAYATHTGQNAVSVIDLQSGKSVGPPISVGHAPDGVAFTPDGTRAYVADVNDGTISVIDTQTAKTIGQPIKVGLNPDSIAITPDGSRAYFNEAGNASVGVIDLRTNAVVGSPIAVGHEPSWVAMTPDGRFVYVAIEHGVGSGTVAVIETATDKVVVPAIPVGKLPNMIAISPDGGRAYVANYGSDTVTVIDAATNTVVGSPVSVGALPSRLAVTPDSNTVYVSNDGAGSVSAIAAATDTVVGLPIPVGEHPEGIAVTPNQPPRASFSVAPSTRARPGVPVGFDASASTDPDGSIAAYAWSFGDGATAAGGPKQTHTYAQPGTYKSSLTLTDNEGCSTSFISTGATASCNGSSLASAAQTLTVAYPGVRLRCPKSAKPNGCRFKLQVVSKKRKGRAESAVATAIAKAGHSVIVSLKPKQAFANQLAAAKRILVKETLTANSSKRRLFKKLTIVQ